MALPHKVRTIAVISARSKRVSRVTSRIRRFRNRAHATGLRRGMFLHDLDRLSGTGHGEWEAMLALQGIDDAR